MDAHFSEYVAAVRAMQEIYGECPDSAVTDFQGTSDREADVLACSECLGA